MFRSVVPLGSVSLPLSPTLSPTLSVTQCNGVSTHTPPPTHLHPHTSTHTPPLTHLQLFAISHVARALETQRLFSGEVLGLGLGLGQWLFQPTPKHVCYEGPTEKREGGSEREEGEGGTKGASQGREGRERYSEGWRGGVGEGKGGRCRNGE